MQLLVLWAGLKAQWSMRWSLRCESTFQGATPSLDDFVARWMGVLEVWRAGKDLSLCRSDLQHLLKQLLSWFDGGMF